MRYVLLVAAMLATNVMASPVAEPGSSPASALSGVEVQTGFSPGGTALRLVLDSIKGARHEVLVAAYSLTSRPVAGELRAAMERGVTVAVVADRKANDNRYTAVNFLANNGVPVRINDRYEAMHNKFLVIDRSILVTGSFNYSASADSRNAENVVKISGVPDVASAYVNEFSRLWQESQDVAPRYGSGRLINRGHEVIQLD